MKQIRIEKIVLNMGTGIEQKPEAGKKVLKKIVAQEPKITLSKGRNPFGAKRDSPIGCKVTARKNIKPLFKKLLKAKEYLLKDNFDNHGNLSFGIKEYIDIPGTEYDPSMEIIGMDVCITLERPGYSIKRRHMPSKIGKGHKITKKQGIEFIKNTFNIDIR